MEKNFKRTLVTSALPYANGPVHIGHLAGVYVPADIYVRYLRLKGEDVLFIGGSDEHGVPVTQRARKEGITPQDVVDRYHNIIKDSFEGFGISFDVYSRTTSDTHHKFASEFFRKLYDDGKLVEQTSKQFYDVKNEKFLTDRDVVGECPYCHKQAYGNQCEEGCGRALEPTELINPRSKETGETPILKETKNWYLPLNDYQQWLKEWILENHKEWRPNVYGQCKSWLDMDLQPRAMTRDLDWESPYPWRVPTERYSMCGLMPPSDIYQIQRNCVTRNPKSTVLGNSGGRVRIHALCISSARTTSCSTVLSSQ